MLAQCGTRQEDIATVIGISVPTLTKYFRAELERGEILATAQVAQSLYKMATDREKPNVAAAIFWLKARAGWSDQVGRIADPGTPLGKKAQAQLDAANATRDDAGGWGELLPNVGQPMQ